MSQITSPTEAYVIAFQNSEPKHYTRVPNIIDHLTYDAMDSEGNVIKKRLSVFAKELYRILRMIANDYGACWMNRDNLAELANMSTGSITNAKKELEQKFHQLDGQPLINIEENQKSTKVNGTTYHKITIIDIWKWNNAFMSAFNFQKKYGAPSPHDGANPAPSPHDGPPREAPSPHDTNNNQTNKNHLSKEQQPTPAGSLVASLVSLYTKKDPLYPSDQQKHFKERLFPSGQQKRAYDWLVGEGCFEPTAYKISITYSSDDICKASNYTNEMHKKSKKDNKWGYLQQTLKNKYWMKKNREL
jgi:hypothetical protein